MWVQHTNYIHSYMGKLFLSRSRSRFKWLEKGKTLRPWRSSSVTILKKYERLSLLYIQPLPNYTQLKPTISQYLDEQMKNCRNGSTQFVQRANCCNGCWLHCFIIISHTHTLIGLIERVHSKKKICKLKIQPLKGSLLRVVCIPNNHVHSSWMGTHI